MTKNDLDGVITIENECFASEAWSRESFEYGFETEGYIFLCAEENGEITGYIAASHFIDANIDSIAVKKEARRKGLAERLIKEAFKDIKADIFLEVRVSNLPARSLYKKLGFKEYRIRKDYYLNPCEDAVLMVKPCVEPNGI